MKIGLRIGIDPLFGIIKEMKWRNGERQVWGARCRQVERQAARANVKVKIGRQGRATRIDHFSAFLLKMERDAFLYFYTIEQFPIIQFSAQNLRPILPNKIILFLFSLLSTKHPLNPVH